MYLCTRKQEVASTSEGCGSALAKKEDFTPQKNLKALHIRFLPDQTTETNISSREFIKKAEFVNAEAFADQLKEDTPSNGGGNSGGGSSSSQSGNQGGNTGGGSYTPGNPDDDEPGGSDH